MHSNRAVKSYPEVRINLDAIRTYAKGSAPYLAVPIVEDGTRRPAVFCRKHLQAAIAAPVVSAVFNVEANTLTINGGPKACYTLKNLAVDGLPYQIRHDLEKWAERKRKTATVKNLPANLKADAKRRQAVEKLEKKLAKVHVRKPVNPISRAAERWDGSADYTRRETETWAAQKAQRKALGSLYGKYVAHLYKPRGRFPWAEVNADIEAAGMRLDSYNGWSKVCTRIAHKGIDIPDYLKALPQFIGLARKPWGLTPWKFESARESYLRDRQGYFESKHEHDLLTAQIANLKTSEKPLGLQQAELAA